VFDFERREDEEGEPPSRSILGLEGVPPSPFPLVLAAPRLNEEPPNASILGLAGIRASEVVFVQTPPRPGDEPPTRSLLGLEGIGPTRVSSLGVEPGSDGEPPNESILGLGRIRPLVVRPAPAAPLSGRQPASGLFFGMEGIQTDLFPAPAAPRPSREAPRGQIKVPEFESEVQYKPRGTFPVERAVLFSLAVHILLLVFLLSGPVSFVPDARKGLLAAFLPPEKSAEEKIPVIFREFRQSPGPARANPKGSDLSDADRRAAGGDQSKPRSQTPLLPQRPGIEALAPGGPVVRQPFPSRGRDSAEQEASTAMAQAPGTKAQGGPDAYLVPPPGPRQEGAAEKKPLSGLDRAIGQAARETIGHGERGAGFSNPEGGFVDTGPVSFETSWYDWGDYAEAMVRRIKLHWDVPRDAWFKGRVMIRFSIHADGRVSDVEILRPSQNPAYTFAAQQAILTSDPFRPLPKDLLASVPGKDRERIIVTFFYNYSREEMGSSRGPD